MSMLYAYYYYVYRIADCLSKGYDLTNGPLDLVKNPDGFIL